MCILLTQLLELTNVIPLPTIPDAYFFILAGFRNIVTDVLIAVLLRNLNDLNVLTMRVANKIQRYKK